MCVLGYDFFLSQFKEIRFFFSPTEVVGRGSETQLKVGDNSTLSSLSLSLSSSSTTSRELLSQFSTCSG